MKKLGKLLLVGLLAGGLMASVVGCGGADKEKQDAQENKKPVLLVGSETAYPPFESQNEKGEYVGFDMDLIRAIGEAEGYEIQIKSTPFTGLILDLQNGNIDAAISAMTITEKRKQSVDFSEPYIDSGQIIALRADDTRPITKPEDLKGLTIAVQMGTTGQIEAEKIVALDPSTKIKKFDSVDQAFAELANKGADATIVDQPVTKYYIAQGHNEIKMVGEMFTDEKYGIAVQKGDKEVLDVINSGLKKVKESGEYDRIYKKYFGK